MASLRRKPAADPVAIDQPPLAPAPAPVTPHLDHGATNALTVQLESLRHAETIQQQQQHQAALAAAANERCQAWVASNQAAQENFAALDGIHRDAVSSGRVFSSPEYFDFMNSRVASLQQARQHPAHLVEEMKSRTAQDRPPERPQPSRGPLVSAPPSRDVPSGYSGSGSRIRLTREQCELAKMAGISEAEYGKQLLKLNEMKASGDYAERR